LVFGLVFEIRQKFEKSNFMVFDEIMPQAELLQQIFHRKLRPASGLHLQVFGMILAILSK